VRTALGSPVAARPVDFAEADLMRLWVLLVRRRLLFVWHRALTVLEAQQRLHFRLVFPVRA
jgi:hypothetical protein